MTSDPIEPIAPERVATLLAELDEKTDARRRAQREARAATARCREIVVELLRARAVPRSSLIGRPFSDAGLTIIQNEEGLTGRARPDSSGQPL